MTPHVMLLDPYQTRNTVFENRLCVFLKISVRKPYSQVQERFINLLGAQERQFILYETVTEFDTSDHILPLNSLFPLFFFSNLFPWLPSQLGLILCYFFTGTSSLVHSFSLEDQVK